MIGLVTYAKAPTLTDDDRPLIADLARLGVEGRPVRWDDPAERWADYQALVLRSPWDYHVRVEEFRRWLAAIEAAGVALCNPLPVVRWNLHKGYLRGLEQRGVLIPPTRWIARGHATSLSAELREAGWSEAIVKPAISASATDTWRTTGNTDADEARYAQLVLHADVLLQPVIAQVAAVGEWSLMFIDGTFTHAVIKRPASGDFRVQTELGGSAALAHPPHALVVAAERILAMLPGACLYTRIDGVQTPDGFMLMEVEAVEPLLFFAFAPHARAAMARAIARRLGADGVGDALQVQHARGRDA